MRRFGEEAVEEFVDAPWDLELFQALHIEVVLWYET